MFGSKFWEEIFGEQILLNEKKNLWEEDKMGK